MSIAEKLVTVADNVQKVYNAGYEKGKAEGSTDLFQYATFLNSCPFRNAVFPEDLDIYFKIKGTQLTTFPVGLAYVFAGSNAKNVTLEIEEITAKGVLFNNVFTDCAELLSVTLVNTPFCISTNSVNSFANATKLETINGVIDLSLATNVSGMFTKCNSLVDVRFVEGSINKSLTFSACPVLSEESIESIINGLADLTGQTSQDLSVHGDVFNRLTDEQKVSIQNKNWTLSAVA